MGNVLAAESPATPPSPPIAGMPPPPAAGTPFGQMPRPAGTAVPLLEPTLPNPGNFEDLFKKVKGKS